jgi:DNA-binding response OmpR family regulator
MRLLLVEDDKDLSTALSRILKYSKYDVETAYDGLTALDMILHEEYSAIILDIMLPKMDGIEVLRRARDAKVSTPIILLTAKNQVDDKILGLDSGADDYISKPFESKELLARIRAVTRRVNSEVSLLSFGNTTLDHNTFELCAKTKTRLTSKEYKLMELLMMNKNAVLSTQKILDTLWDLDDFVEINVVWVFISMLRKKLEEIGADCYIKAIRGVGYQLEVKSND